MLQTLGCKDLEELTDKAIPGKIRWSGELQLPAARSERDALADLTALAAQNEVHRSYIGMGYHGTLTPAVIQRDTHRAGDSLRAAGPGDGNRRLRSPAGRSSERNPGRYSKGRWKKYAKRFRQ